VQIMRELFGLDGAPDAGEPAGDAAAGDRSNVRRLPRRATGT
jgi:hypothetical protein